MKAFFPLFFTLILPISLSAQQKIFYDSLWNETDSMSAKYYKLTYSDSLNDHQKTETYWISGQIKSSSMFTISKPVKQDGESAKWYPTGILKREELYKDNFLLKYSSFYSNGRIRRRESYEITKNKKGNKMTEGRCYTLEGQDTTFFPKDSKPASFPENAGSLPQYINSHLPHKIRSYVVDRQIRGKVLVSFFITNKGDIIDIKVVQGIDPKVDDEILKLISNMPRWSPFMEEGGAVEMRVTMPISFQ